MDLKNPVWEHQAQKTYGNENPKIPRVENLKNGFRSPTAEEAESVRKYINSISVPILGPDGKPIKFFDFYKKPKKKLDNLDKYLIFTFTSLILFTIATLVIFCITGNEPAVLVGCFFGAFGGEILMCALIKRLKLHKEAKLKKDDGDTFT